uniref:Uncharacterized protein n=1 Tax=viral metagenome TaxID=1070528 RepID=A0A6C0JTL8_9ZZZZ
MENIIETWKVEKESEAERSSGCPSGVNPSDKYTRFYKNKTIFNVNTLFIIKTGYDDRFCTSKEVLNMYINIINSKNPPRRFNPNYLSDEDYIKLVNTSDSGKNAKISKNDFYPIGFKENKELVSFDTGAGQRAAAQTEGYSSILNKRSPSFNVEELEEILRDIPIPYSGFIFGSGVPYTFKNIKKVIENLGKAYFCGRMCIESTDDIILYQTKKIKDFNQILVLNMDCESG